MVRKLLSIFGTAFVFLCLVVAGYAQNVGGGAAPKAAKASAAAPVNLNTAGAIELQTLPNVGPATAARIIEYRQKNGGFKKIEDLMNVKGIGEKSFLKLKPLVVVSAPKTDD